MAPAEKRRARPAAGLGSMLQPTGSYFDVGLRLRRRRSRRERRVAPSHNSPDREWSEFNVMLTILEEVGRVETQSATEVVVSTQYEHTSPPL